MGTNRKQKLENKNGKKNNCRDILNDKLVRLQTRGCGDGKREKPQESN